MLDSMKKRGLAVVTGAGALLASTQSFALDTAVATAIDTQLAAVQADGIEIAGKVWPVLIILAGAAIAMKLFKRFVSKV